MGEGHAAQTESSRAGTARLALCGATKHFTVMALNSQGAESAVSTNAQSEVANARAISKHPAWDIITKLAAPVAVVVSAASYLTGYVYKLVLFRSFGFRPELIESSVQDTVSFGYAYLAATSTFIVVAVFLFLVLLNWVNSRMTAKSLPVHSAKQKFLRFLLYLNAVNFGLFLMILSVLSGGITGLVDARAYRNDLKSHCHKDCFHFVTKRGSFNGILLGQSKDISVAVSKSSAYIVQTSDLKSISPVNRRRGWQSMLLQD
ncbi:hypothetical protein [Sphingomonas sp. BAUL-RG-20F-R05-02]|uniref:hypothetical protein n=1 Tax=Sphingomonas sp. BAUL-RG-20F-R05-02 TaxID=2914830 RepID=UPI001F5AD4CC|nr:hypothetical protein [Sphingomonas sp. BAUL-RG-20F-R05-02]